MTREQRIKNAIAYFENKKQMTENWFKRVGSAWTGYGIKHEQEIAIMDRYINRLKKQL